MIAAQDGYAAALRDPCAGWQVEDADGRRAALPVRRWRAAHVEGDVGLLDRCVGPVLDVGCGPGRIAAALAARRVPVLGIDVAPYAVALARRSGAVALRRDVFGRIPGAGRWATVVLADGNIGIGGDPARLLARVRDLLGTHGRALVEVDPPGRPDGSALLRLVDPAGRRTAPFRWARVNATALPALAGAAGFVVTCTWGEAGRCFAALT